MDTGFELFIKANMPQDKAFGFLDAFVLIQKAWEAGRKQGRADAADEKEREFERRHGPRHI